MLYFRLLHNFRFRFAHRFNCRLWHNLWLNYSHIPCFFDRVDFDLKHPGLQFWVELRNHPPVVELINFFSS